MKRQYELHYCHHEIITAYQNILQYIIMRYLHIYAVPLDEGQHWANARRRLPNPSEFGSNPHPLQLFNRV